MEMPEILQKHVEVLLEMIKSSYNVSISKKINIFLVSGFDVFKHSVLEPS